MYINIERAKQQTSCCMTSESALPSFHLITLMFLSIYSLATFVCSFLSAVTFTPRYLTTLVHLTSPIYWRFSHVRISDFFLFSRKFHFSFSTASSSITCSISCCESDITSISSAKARRSPLLISSTSFLDDFRASSRYTLKRTGDSMEPYGRPISAFIL